MTELRPIGRELIAVARRERTPNASARARVLAVVLASASAATGAATVKAAPSVALKASSGLIKGLLIAAIGAASVTGVYAWMKRDRVSAAYAVVPNLPQTAAIFGAVPPMPAAPVVPPSSTAASSNNLKTAGTASGAPGQRSLDQELSLLQRAHAAYRAGAPGTALALAREHGRSFPHSQLVDEQRTIEVLSLCALGRRNEAKVLAKRLLGTSESPSLSGLDGSCVSN